MKFKHLMNIKRNEGGAIDIAELTLLLPKTPTEVIKQFYSDHGRKDEFQIQYGKLNLKKLLWNKKEVSGLDLINCSIYEDFNDWVNSVSKKMDYFNKEGWKCIGDYNDSIEKNWEQNMSWLVPPIFINGRIIGIKNKYKLVEGHTRLGILKGSLKNKIFEDRLLHAIWYGDYI